MGAACIEDTVRLVLLIAQHWFADIGMPVTKTP